MARKQVVGVYGCLGFLFFFLDSHQSWRGSAGLRNKYTLCTLGKSVRQQL
jgi:hypothetical protein